jgi:hypothetical protein
MQEKPFGWFKMQENMDKVTIENIFKHRQYKYADKAE